jgi:hypothetical protein
MLSFDVCSCLAGNPLPESNGVAGGASGRIWISLRWLRIVQMSTAKVGNGNTRHVRAFSKGANRSAHDDPAGLMEVRLQEIALPGDAPRCG